MKHHPLATANAVAGTVALADIVCAILFTIAPEFTMSVAKSWFHGIQLVSVDTIRISADAFIVGLVTAIVAAWLTGYIFAYLYNMSVKK